MDYPKIQSRQDAIDRWGSMVDALCDGDEDLRQELLIETCNVFDRFDKVTDGLVKQRLVRRRLMYWRGNGSSIDNGPSTRKFKLICIGDSDIICGCVNNESNDPEEVALFRIVYEQLLGSLSEQECEYWIARCQGLGWRDIEQRGIADRNIQPIIKKRLRVIFRKHFGQ